MNATIYQLSDGSGGWAVERCEPENDGLCHKAIFYGPDAEVHARDHMAMQFGDAPGDVKGAT